MKKLEFRDEANAYRYVVFNELAKLYKSEKQITQLEFCDRCVVACERTLLKDQWSYPQVDVFAAEVWQRYDVF